MVGYMIKNNVAKKLGKELLRYRKKQYIILKILIALLALFESSILVIVYNESYVLSNGKDFEIAIIGLFVLWLLFLLTYYSIEYINLYIDRKNFYNLFLIGFMEKDILQVMKYFGKCVTTKYALIGGALGIGLGTLLTWKYKHIGGLFISILLLIIMYITLQIATKKCVKRVWKLKDVKTKIKKEQKRTYIETLNLRKISLKYIMYNKNRVWKMNILILISGLILTFAITMIQSISLNKYIANTWGDSDYKIILNKKGNTSGDYHYLQIDNPLTEELLDDIEKTEGVEDVIPNYSIQAVIELKNKEIETRIREISDEILIERNIRSLQDEVVISVRSDYFEQISNQIRNGMISVEYFDGDEKKNVSLKVKDIFIDDTQATRIYASKECIKKMVSKSSPILSFYVYGQETDVVQSQIEKLIDGKTLELQCKKNYVIETEKSFDVIRIGIVSIMVILMLFSTSVLLNSKLINLMVQKQDFDVLQNIGMTHSDIKNVILVEDLICSSVTSVFAYIMGIALSNFTCDRLEKMGSTFWEFHFNIISLLTVGLLLGVLTYIEIKFYNKIVISAGKNEIKE